MYPYITHNNLEHIQAYNYTAFGGSGFLRAYLSTREPFVENTSMPLPQLVASNEFIHRALEDRQMLRLLIKTFEVNKRLYARYEMGHSAFSGEQILKPHKESAYTHIDDYLIFANALAKAFSATHNLLYLNTLLKLNDTLISIKSLGEAYYGGGGVYALFSKTHK